MSFNWIPSLNGISDTISPSSIVTGVKPLSILMLKITFGTYVQEHDDMQPSNTTASRSTGAIALYPHNSTTAWNFLSLTTGACIVRCSWSMCVMISDVIACIHAFADAQPKESPLSQSTPTFFEWSPGDVIADVNDIEGADMNIDDIHPQHNNPNTNANADEPQEDAINEM